VATAKHSLNCRIGRSGLQVPLPAEWGGFIHPVSQRAAPVEDVLTHIMGNAVSGGPWGQMRILRWRASAMGLIRIHK
jgi:hypothetical protein